MKIYISDNGTGNEYIIDQAAAGNWCVEVKPYAGESEHYACFDSEGEAYAFILGYEQGYKPYLVLKEEED